MRTIVDLAVRPDTQFGAVGYTACDFGIAVIEQDALAAAALPDLNFGDDQPVRGWVFRKRMMIEDHTTAVIERRQHLFLDLKSKRKIDDSELVLIINNNLVQGTAITTLTEGLIRCLFLMP